MDETMRIHEGLEDLAALLRESYWKGTVSGAEAMRDIWAEFADNREGLEETARDIKVTIDDFHQAANMLAEWLRTNGLMNTSPMASAANIRKEKLKFPEHSC